MLWQIIAADVSYEWQVCRPRKKLMASTVVDCGASQENCCRDSAGVTGRDENLGLMFGRSIVTR